MHIKISNIVFKKITISTLKIVTTRPFDAFCSGPACLAGLGLMIAILPLNTFLMNKMRFLMLRQMKLKDERLKMSTEILNGIKVRIHSVSYLTVFTA